jgi:hypothetical protein
LRSRCRPSPCTWLSHARSTTAAPPLPRPDRQTVCPARSPARAERTTGKTGEVPVFTDRSFVGVGVRLYPPRPRHGYAAVLHRGLPSGLEAAIRKLPALAQDEHAPQPAQIRQVRADVTLGGFPHRFLSYTSPSCSPDPHHLAVLTRPGFVGAACHPPRHLPDRAAPSFTALLRQDGGEGLSPPLDQSAPHGARARYASDRPLGPHPVHRRGRLRRRRWPGPGR